MKSLGSKSKELYMKMLEHPTMNKGNNKLPNSEQSYKGKVNVSRFRILLNINGSLKKIRQNHV